jgi:hypothetical protein
MRKNTLFKSLNSDKLKSKQKKTVRQVNKLQVQKVKKINLISHRDSMVLQIFASSSLTFIEMKEALHSLIFISLLDFRNLVRNIDASEREFLDIVQNVLLPESVYCWKGIVIAQIMNGTRVNISTQNRRTSEFYNIHKFFQEFKKAYGGDLFASTFLHCIKVATEQKLDPSTNSQKNDFVMKSTFLSCVFNLFIRYLFSAMGNTELFIEIKKQSLVNKSFCSKILTPLMRKYEYLTIFIEYSGSRTKNYIKKTEQ